MAPSLINKIRAAGGSKVGSGGNVNKSRIQWLGELSKNCENDWQTPNELDFIKLRQVYGQPLSSYVRFISDWLELYRDNCDCGLRKTKTGVFFIEKPEFYKQCVDLAVKGMQDKHLRLADVLKKQREKKSSGPKTQLPDEHQIASEPTNKSDGKKSIPIAGPKSNIATNLIITFRYPETDQNYHKSRLKAFDLSQTRSDRIKRGLIDVDLYKHAMETRDGTENFVDPYDSSEAIRKLLTELQRRHCKFRYFEKLKHILKDKNKDVVIVTLKEYRTFVYKVYEAVIPSALFGCNKNAKKLRKVLKTYYLSQFKSPFDLTQCFNSLDVSKIRWLGAYKEPTLKRTMLAKITKWIFESYFFRVFRAVFREEKSLTDDKRVMMSVQRWERFKRDYIATKMRLGQVKKLSDSWEKKVYYSTFQLPCVTMRLIPKSEGARPLHKSHIDYEQEKDIELLKTFLMQLYLQKHELLVLNQVYSTWHNHATKIKENNTRQKLNLVCCDVADAFGSIIQEKLMSILMKMMDELPEQLYRATYEVMTPGSSQSPLQVEHRQWYNYFLEAPVLKGCSLIVRRIDNETERVSKDYILSKLRPFILKQTFWYENNEYLSLCGVCQGTALSSILSDIYYQQMTIDHFGKFLESGTLFRYVDDFLYATTDEVMAKRFLRAAKRGVPEYNCRFATQKMQTNFEARPCRKSEWVAYIGYEFNGETMAIRPKREQSELQYSRTLLKWLRDNQSPDISKLMNIQGALKVHPMVLDPKLDGLTGLCETAGFVANKRATLYAFLLTKSFTSDELTRQSELVIQELRSNVERLERTFRRLFRASDRAQWPDFRKELSLAIWRSFYRTFAKNPQLRDICLAAHPRGK